MMGDANTSGSKPVHQVTITKPFYLAACEVTNVQFELYKPTYVRNGKSPSDNTPANCISYSQAVGFCQWLTQREASTTGLVYRLPHEIEWEWAAHGGCNYPYPICNPKNLPAGMGLYRALQNEANCYGSGGPDVWEFCSPVGSLAPNGYGLYDMIGNIKEWCVNKSYDYPSTPVIHDPSNPGNVTESKSHMIRGNSYWTGETDALTLYYRIWYGNNDISPKTGLRVMALAPTTPPVPQQLTAKASAKPTTVNVNATVAFTGSALGGTAPYVYSWDFGDGTSSRVACPTHVYAVDDSFTAILTVSDAVGDSSESSVKITVNPLPVPGDDTVVTVAVAVGNDDGQEKASSGAVLDRVTITVGYGYLNGFRFTNVAIPNGATIVSAKLSTAPEATDRYKALSLTYWGESANNAAPFGTSGTAKMSARVRTLNSVAYPNVPAWVSSNVYYDSADLASIIQEIVGRSGWVSGNALVILQEGGAASGRVIWAKEGSVNLPPKLTVTYINP
jgi:PKD repeat protein